MSTATIPGYVAGTWDIDAVHSDVSFTVRHMMVSKVRGHFGSFSGQIVTAENPLDSTVTATVDLNSINTNNEARDNHIRSADFFETEKYKEMTYHSTGLRPDGENFILDGQLTLHGVTHRVPLKLELGGFGPDGMNPGGTRVGFSATGELNRRDFGIDITIPMDGGGVVVSDKVQLHLEIEGVLRQA